MYESLCIPIPNLPSPTKKRIVIIGGGFAGLKLARKLKNSNYNVVLLDKNNYHQFQPLFYQVATAGLQPSAISFPLRRIFHDTPNITFRMAEAKKIDQEEKRIYTNIGYLDYDYLVLGMGANTNYFGLTNIMEHSIPMKSVSEALFIRNKIISNYDGKKPKAIPVQRSGFYGNGGKKVGCGRSPFYTVSRDYGLAYMVVCTSYGHSRGEK